MNRILIVIFASVLLFSCREKAKIKVKNDVSSVRITEIYWGDISIGGSLSPGETTSERVVYKSDESLPSSKTITFRMLANNKEVYLETEDEYLLDYDDDLLIVIDDNTAVFNP